MLPRVVDVINAAGVARFVLMPSLGVGETRARGSFLPRVVFGAIANNLFTDKAIAERSLVDLDADWIAVYRAGLKKGHVAASWNLVSLDRVRSVPGIPMLSFATVA